MKAHMRFVLKKRREAISQARRAAAQKALLTTLLPVLTPYSSILSFASFKDEIDLTALNHTLASEGRLRLPKIGNHGELEIYQVSSADELKKNALGIFEPDPAKCARCDALSLILVPGLGFDAHYNRIGYGGGYYDRLLQRLCYTPTLGVGFHEQFVPLLPQEAHDWPLQALYLF